VIPEPDIPEPQIGDAQNPDTRVPRAPGDPSSNGSGDQPESQGG